MPSIQPDCAVCNLKINVKNIEAHLTTFSFFAPDTGQGYLDHRWGPRYGGARAKPLIMFEYCIEDIKCGGYESELNLKPFKPVKVSAPGVPNPMSPRPPDSRPPEFNPTWEDSLFDPPLGAKSEGGTFWTQGWQGDQAFTEPVCCKEGRHSAPALGGFGRELPCCKYMQALLQVKHHGIGFFAPDVHPKGPVCREMNLLGDMIDMPWSDWVRDNPFPDVQSQRRAWFDAYEIVVNASLSAVLTTWIRNNRGALTGFIVEEIKNDIRKLFVDYDVEYRGYFWPGAYAHSGDPPQASSSKWRWCRCEIAIPGVPTGSPTYSIWKCK